MIVFVFVLQSEF